MPDLGTLRPGQQAILRSLSEPGSSYADVARRLETTPDGVRRVAREALEGIAGRPSQVDEAWRQRLTDFALGQSTSDERAEVLAKLDRSAAARAWTARAVEGLPPALRHASLPPIRPAEPPSAAARRRRGGRGARAEGGTRRREFLLGALAALGAALVAGLALLRAAGPERVERPAGGGAGVLRVERQVRLESTGEVVGAGIAVVAARGARREILVQARVTSSTGGRYELRLSREGGEPRSLGAVRADERGNLRAALRLPGDYRSYGTLDLVRVGGEGALSGRLGAG
jgi:hypothetical protein